MLLERLRPASATQKGAWLDNMVVLGVGVVCRGATGPLLAVGVAIVINAAGGGLIDLGALPFWLGAAIWLVAMDFGEYVFHRAQHVFPWMWAMHSLHHSDRGMNVSTSQRHFWLEPAIKSVSTWLAPALLFKTSGPILTFYYVFSLYHLFLHANLRVGFGPLSWVLNSPQYHRLHHSGNPAHFNANYASLLPIFDVISGAYRPPAKGEYPDTGLADAAVGRPWDLVIWPVRGLVGGLGKTGAETLRGAS
jgi:sterol desaturase/sphingolipid hydroxylase (fatty acid hydroxylase superfamily)